MTYLAADELAGRATGTPGADQAARYIAEQFRALGLRPVGAAGSFFQHFTLDDGTRGKNVLARLPGRGDLADRVTIVSAHYDHLGSRPEDEAVDGDTICNGADDNASGVAALLLIAEDLARRAAGPFPDNHRSVVFAAFDAEETGLGGSRFYTENPPVALARTDGVVNFDMVGRLRGGKLYAGDAPTSPLFLDVLEELQERTGIPIETRFGGVARSDQAPFLDHQVPGVHFNTGLYPEYHSPADEVGLIDHEGGAEIAAIGAALVEAILTHDGPLPFRKLDPSYDIQHAIRLVTLLGAVPNVRAQEGRHPRVLFVTPGSPAAVCGIRAGDQLAAVNGLTIERVEDAVAVVPQLRFEDGLRVTLVRDGESIEIDMPAVIFQRLSGPEVQPRNDGRYDVTFRCRPPRGVPGVALVGSFNDWDPSARPLQGPARDGSFSTRIVLPAGTYEYKFVIEGHGWISDPDNLHQVGGQQNSVVWVGPRENEDTGVIRRALHSSP